MPTLSSTQLVDPGDVLLAKRDLNKVGGDARGRDGLGDDRVAADGAPGDEDLSGGGADPVKGVSGVFWRGGGSALFRDGDDLRVLEELLGSDVVVTERRVGSDVAAQVNEISLEFVRERTSENVHSVRLVVSYELGLDEQRVALDLVDRGSHSSSRGESVNLRVIVRQRAARARRREVRGAVKGLTAATLKLETPTLFTLPVARSLSIAFQVSTRLGPSGPTSSDTWGMPFFSGAAGKRFCVRSPSGEKATGQWMRSARAISLSLGSEGTRRRTHRGRGRSSRAP